MGGISYAVAGRGSCGEYKQPTGVNYTTQDGPGAITREEYFRTVPRTQALQRASQEGRAVAGEMV